MLHDGCSSCNCYTPSKVHSHSFGPSFFADNILSNNSTVFKISDTIINPGVLAYLLMPFTSADALPVKS